MPAMVGVLPAMDIFGGSFPASPSAVWGYVKYSLGAAAVYAPELGLLAYQLMEKM